MLLLVLLFLVLLFLLPFCKFLICLGRLLFELFENVSHLTGSTPLPGRIHALLCLSGSSFHIFPDFLRVDISLKAFIVGFAVLGPLPVLS